MTASEHEQRKVIDFLTDALGENGAPPKIVTTHISVIFLTGSQAYKLKRAVKYPFLDFTSLEARKDACTKEVEINKRTAPSIYKGVIAITEKNGAYELGGNGPVRDWLVEMTRFDEDTLFDRLARVERGLRRPMIEDLADVIADFHANAAVKKAGGGAAGIRKIAENNVRAFDQQHETGIFETDRVSALTTKTLEMIDDLSGILDTRRDNGRVRACHGDLHLRNICLVEGKPTLFDAIEFSSDFSDIDVLYDLAFLLMDLDSHDRRRLASFLMNRYLDVGDEDMEAFRVLPIFLTMRAQIRAHVGAAIAVSQSDPAIAARETGAAQRYLDLAETYVQEKPPRVVAVGGLSGSGKSRLAREIASYLGRAPGARVVRTDVVRKRLCGIHPNETLGPEGYTLEVTEKTYEAFLDQAKAALMSGQCVVLDAVFANPAQRRAAAELARSCKVPFTGIWVDAPEEVRVERVMSRKRNVSDVTADVARDQSGYNVGEVDWDMVDSSGKKKETVRQALSILKL